MILNPIKVKNTEFKNRVVMPPMCMYSVFEKDGKATDFHYVHYLSRAVGGVGYIIVESTAVTPNGRITTEDLGIWNDEQIEGLKKIVDGVHAYGAKIGLQINHAGRKSTVGNIVSASSTPFSKQSETPHALSIAEIKEIAQAFGQSARRANAAGFDSLEIHAAHGYLIAQFISPVSNQRDDQYQDGALFLKNIIDEILKYWPKEKILQIRVSGYEHLDDGITPYDWSSILNNYKSIIDIINVSSGGIIPVDVKEYPGYQLPYAQIIKEETGMLVIAGGQLNDFSLANEAIKNQTADFIYFGRKLLMNPYFIYEQDETLLPKQYARATQLKK